MTHRLALPRHLRLHHAEQHCRVPTHPRSTPMARRGRALQAALGEDGLGTWSFDVAAGRGITTVVDPLLRGSTHTASPGDPDELLDAAVLLTMSWS